VMAARGFPDEAELIKHGEIMITTKGTKVHGGSEVLGLQSWVFGLGSSFPC
jgi:ribosomal protein L27